MSSQVNLCDEEAPTEALIQALLGAATDVIALLDGNRIPNLPELLSTEKLDHVCLFQGHLEEDAGDASPWLVRLPMESRLLKQVLTPQTPDRPNSFAYWDAEPGIFFHTVMTLPDLRQHLRRFLRVTTQNDQMFMFRFWEPSTASLYFTGLNDRPELVQRWLQAREGGQITQIVVPKPTAEGPVLDVMSPTDLPAQSPAPVGAFTLSAQDIARFQQVSMERDIDALAKRLMETFPDAAASVEGGSILKFTARTMARMMEFGFAQKTSLFTLLAWELHYGPGFERRDRAGTLNTILTSSESEQDRFRLLKARMESFG
ncbi:MAG: DUF4123 domain-containing protein [Aliishimia sp.]